MISAGTAFPAVRGDASTGSAGNWSTYLDGPAHQSYGAGQTVITSATVRELTPAWTFLGDPPTHRGQPPRGFLSSPTVVDGVIYIGADTGWFYKIDAATGAVLAKRFIGYQPAKTCDALGFVDTATVVVDHASGQRMVYVGGPDGYLYALRAANLSVAWRSVIGIPSRTVSNYFEWASPTIARGRIYIGISSNCDHPLVRGGLISFSQATGRRLATFYTLPRGIPGGSIWSSAAIGPDRDIYVTTGNAIKGYREPPYSDSMLKLDPSTLRVLGSFAVPAWQVIADGDFGASPTIFGGDVGACDKNGVFYALHRSSMTLAWSRRIGAPQPRHGNSTCIAAAVYDGRSLYVAGGGITLRGKRYFGSIQRLDPSTGRRIWATGLPDVVTGSPTLDGAGVLAVGTYGGGPPNVIDLVSAATGRILRTLVTGQLDFAQTVFADGMLFTADSGGLTGWRLR
ncbi:MAG TPA: PQQ-binding-like beta-propeller repeat protein [Streptosporangiaceae bacterium]|nr:PQQ-binding-like beta-propeller repeat protein [Streptosporangiaceae bacterium]